MVIWSILAPDRHVMSFLKLLGFKCIVNRFQIVGYAHMQSENWAQEWKRVEFTVTCHTCALCGLLRIRVIDENNAEYAYENHFLLNVDSGCKLEFSGDHEVKYTGTISGDKRSTVLGEVSVNSNSLVSKNNFWCYNTTEAVLQSELW